MNAKEVEEDEKDLKKQEEEEEEEEEIEITAGEEQDENGVEGNDEE